MSRRIFGVDVSRISLLTRGNEPAVERASTRFVIRKFRKKLLSCEEQKRLEKLLENWKQTT